MKAYIKAIAYYLPQRIVTNEELAQDFPEWSVEKIMDKVGVNKRHIAAKNETATDMAVAAAQKLLDQGVDKTTIDYVLFCTQSPDYYLPASACIIQDKLGLSKNTGALDFNQGCSGYIYMNGSEIFSFTLTSVPSLVKKTLMKNGTVKEDIDLYIFHQANKYMLDFLKKKLKIDDDKFYLCLSEVGNTVSSTIPIAICEAMKDGSLKKGVNSLLAGFGVGYSSGGVIIKL